MAHNGIAATPKSLPRDGTLDLLIRNVMLLQRHTPTSDMTSRPKELSRYITRALCNAAETHHVIHTPVYTSIASPYLYNVRRLYLSAALRKSDWEDCGCPSGALGQLAGGSEHW